MIDHTLLRWRRIEGDRNERRAGERRSGEDRRRGERRQETSRTAERRAVEPLRAVVPEALEFVTAWQIAEPLP